MLEPHPVLFDQLLFAVLQSEEIECRPVWNNLQTHDNKVSFKLVAMVVRCICMSQYNVIFRPFVIFLCHCAI